MDIDTLFNAIGLAGGGLILLTYFLLQTDRIQSDGVMFPLCNALGSLCLILSIMWQWNMASLVINIFWVAISIYGILKALKKPSQNHPVH